MSIDLVYDRTFISDGRTAEKAAIIRDRGITRIVTVALEYDPSHSGVVVKRCGLHDEFEGRPRNTADQLRAAVMAYVRSHQAGETVLVHCHAGHNRSGATVAAGLVVMGVYPNVFEAYGRIAAKRQLRIQPLLLQHLAEIFPAVNYGEVRR